MACVLSGVGECDVMEMGGDNDNDNDAEVWCGADSGVNCKLTFVLRPAAGEK